MIETSPIRGPRIAGFQSPGRLHSGIEVFAAAPAPGQSPGQSPIHLHMTCLTSKGSQHMMARAFLITRSVCILPYYHLSWVLLRKAFRSDQAAF